MRSVSISDLKAHLSKYLGQVRRGADVQIMDRGVPVARLTRISGAPADDRSRIQRLVRAGVLRAGTAKFDWVLEEPPLSIPDANVSGAVEEEREDRA